MYRSVHSQRGASLSGTIFGLVIFAFLASAAIKVVPAYLEFSTVKSIMDGSAAATRKSSREVLSDIGRKLEINNIDVISPKDFQLKRGKGGEVLAVAYEVREHLFGNVDVVTSFRHQVMLRRQ
jgi:hypothetical protein